MFGRRALHQEVLRTLRENVCNFAQRGRAPEGKFSSDRLSQGVFRHATRPTGLMAGKTIQSGRFRFDCQDNTEHRFVQSFIHPW